MRPRLARLRSRIVAAGSIYVLVMAALAAFAAAPIYGTPAGPAYVRVATVGIVAAFAVAATARVWQWKPWLIGVVAATVFVVLSVSVAVPPIGSPAGIAEALRQTALGVVTGWKDLLTVDLPVGSYRNLLVPALAVLFAGTLSVLLLSWWASIRGTWAALPAIAMSAFGLLFGSPVASGALHVGGLAIGSPRELVVGALVLVASVTWLSWRTREQRREALVRAADASGVRVVRRGYGAHVQQAALAALMVAVAVFSGVALTPLVAEGRTRDVLREATGPEEALRHAVSPLAAYRGYTNAEFDEPLFTVEAVSGDLPERLRLAVLTSYDGAEYRVDGDDGLFTRVPDGRAPAAGTRSTVRIQVSGLRGIWTPTFGSLARAEFDGKDAAPLADGFYYDARTDAAVETSGGGLHEGDEYELTASVGPARSLADLEPSGERPAVALPRTVTDWIAQQRVSRDGAGLQTLVQRLRERGYLSHALLPAEGGAAWQDALGKDYVFQPSASGHSLSRIDVLFRSLLDRSNRVAQNGEGPDASLVAAVGDDEQFAVATALLAQQLGFPSRVVVGVRLSDSELPACRAGVCTGGDVAAWAEVRDRDGMWVAVDATPQHVRGLDPIATRQRDPENPTEVRPQTAHEVVPPDPVHQDAANGGDRRDPGPDLEPLWAALRLGTIGLIVAALIAAPFLAVVSAKAARRRRRRRSADARARVEGGWDEFVDTAVDFGMPHPGVRTRSELAVAYATPGARALAVGADRAVFSDAEPSAEDADAFWEIVEAERRSLGEGHTFRRRMRAAVSLTSFVRAIRRDVQDPRGDDAGHRRPTT